MTITTQTNQVTFNACQFHGVALDKWVEQGLRGGKKVWWRAAWSRNFQVSAWSHTRVQAARCAPGYRNGN